MVQIELLNKEARTGTILVAVAGGLSTLAVSLLLLHMAFVAIRSPLKQLSSSQNVPRERVTLTTHLGYYLTCLLISGLFLGVASFLEILWAQEGVILQDSRCNTQGIFLQLGEIGTAAFSVIIAFHTMNNLVLQKRLPTYAALLTIAIGWITAVVLAIIGPFMDSNFYDIEGLWCWVSINHATFQVFGNIVLLLFSVVLMCFLYGATYIKLRSDVSDQDDDLSLGGSVALSNDDYRKFLRPIARKLFFYPLVFATLILPVSILRVMALFGMSIPTYAIIIAAVCDALMGFANTVVYVTTRNIGPSIFWGGMASSVSGLLRPDSAVTHASFFPRRLDSLVPSERFGEKAGILYSFGGPGRFDSAANSFDGRVKFANPTSKPEPVLVRIPEIEEAPPSFRPMHKAEDSYSSFASSEYSPEDKTPNPALLRRTGAAESVSRWRERQSTYSNDTPSAVPAPMGLPTSPQQNARHLRTSRSLGSLSSFDRTRTPTPSNRQQASTRFANPFHAPQDSEDGSTIIESYLQEEDSIPNALRPRIPPPGIGIARSISPASSYHRSDPNAWSFHSQESLIGHMRNISNGSVSTTASGLGNVPFATQPRSAPGPVHASHPNPSLTALAQALQGGPIAPSELSPPAAGIRGAPMKNAQSSRTMI